MEGSSSTYITLNNVMVLKNWIMLDVTLFFMVAIEVVDNLVFDFYF